MKLKEWRRAKGISQEKMAEHLGVHVGTYINWEKQPEKISISNAVKISKILDVPLNSIIFQREEAS